VLFRSPQLILLFDLPHNLLQEVDLKLEARPENPYLHLIKVQIAY